MWYVAQSDGNTLSKATKDGLIASTPEAEAVDEETERHLGLARGSQHWASCIQAIDPLVANAATSTIEFGDNEAALSCVCVPFESRNWEVYLAVGTGQHMMPGSGQQSSGSVHIYKLIDDGKSMELVHKVRLITLASLAKMLTFFLSDTI